MRDKIRLFLTGFTMGASDIVPGVSGGTIAFIFGIYEELIYSIKKLSGETLKLVLAGNIKGAFKSIPFGFLVPLGLGVITAFITLAHLLEYLLHTYPQFVWSFFFGLVLASIWIVRKRVVTWDLHDYAALAGGTIIAFIIAGAVPVETSSSLLAFFVAGFIAIIAMILPGVSGSYLLVLMGKYEQILSAVNTRDFVLLGAVAIGAAIGISVFSRVLTWAFARHHDIIIATLTGFMIGSLRKIWPWEGGVPEQVDFSVIFSVILASVAAIIMLRLDKMQATKEHVEDVEDTSFKKGHKKAISSQKKHVL